MLNAWHNYVDTEKCGRWRAPVSLHFYTTQRRLHEEQGLTTTMPKEFLMS